MEKIHIICECYTHMLQIECHTDTHDAVIEKDSDPVEVTRKSFYISMWNYGKTYVSFREKLRLIWKIIRTGEPFSDQVTLNEEEAKKLVDFINERI